LGWNGLGGRLGWSGLGGRLFGLDRYDWFQDWDFLLHFFFLWNNQVMLLIPIKDWGIVFDLI